MSVVGGAFTVRFLRNGDQVYIEPRILNESGAGNGLFQVIDTTTGSISPDWEKETAKQPIIRLEAKSSAGYPVRMTGIQWAYDGVTLVFPVLTSVFQAASNDERFMARINDNGYELRIVKNLAGKDVVSNKQINYELSYVSNALTDTIRGSMDVFIQQAGENSHILQILYDRILLDAVNTSATLTAKAQYGTKDVAIGTGGYTLDWYKDGEKIDGQTGVSLTVTRDMVSGGSIFSAKLYKDGSLVAQDGQRVSDIADEYRLEATPTSANNMVSLSQNAVYKLSVTKNGSPVVVNESSYSWQVYNALGVITKADGAGSTVVVSKDYCVYQSGEDEMYADVDVRVSVTM